jgi:hypothetical protein
MLRITPQKNQKQKNSLEQQLSNKSESYFGMRYCSLKKACCSLKNKDCKLENTHHYDIDEISDWDSSVLRKLVTLELTPSEVELIENPPFTDERESCIMAVHWHPESIPLDLIRRRIRSMYPNAQDNIIIPTQHNTLVEMDGFCGVEVDSHSEEFNRKVQLLFHFTADRVENATTFKAMLSHTYKYRSSQFFDFLDTLTLPQHSKRIEEALRLTELDKETLIFVQAAAAKLRKLINKHSSEIPEQSLKNKLIPAWFMELKSHFDEHMVNRSLIFLKSVKEIVKRQFVLTYFYSTREVIEEARGLGCGVVIPHPEQFWPILLADYNVDGYEVWNPQSREFTEFLIQVVIKKNSSSLKKSRPLLVFMGDDTHMGEKIKDFDRQDTEKASREIGYQPPWNDPGVRKKLSYAQYNKLGIIEEYRYRLLNP